MTVPTYHLRILNNYRCIFNIPEGSMEHHIAYQLVEVEIYLGSTMVPDEKIIGLPVPAILLEGAACDMKNIRSILYKSGVTNYLFCYMAYEVTKIAY